MASKVGQNMSVQIGMRSYLFLIDISLKSPLRVPYKDRHYIVELLDILYQHGLLKTLFVDIYSKATEDYYKEESKRLASSDDYKDSPKKFLEHVSQRLDEENKRSAVLFAKYDWCSRDIESATETSLMEDRLIWLSKGVATAIDSRDMEGLTRMYTLFARVDGLKLLCDEFKLHVHVSRLYVQWFL